MKHQLCGFHVMQNLCKKKLTAELQVYIDTKDYVSDMLKVETKQSGKNRCTDW